MFYKIFRKQSENIKICCIDTNIISITNHKYYLCKLFYKIVTHFYNKTLYNKVFFGTNLTDLLMYSRTYRTHPKFNHAKKVV